MSAERDPQRERLLDQVWDALLQGDDDAADALDRADAHQLRWMVTHDDRPAPSAAFRRHLREELMAIQSTQVPNPSLVLSPNGRGPQRRPPFQPGHGRPGAWPQVMPVLSVAVLVTLLVGGYLLLSAMRGGFERSQTLLPVIATAPTPTTETVLEAQVTALPMGPAQIGVSTVQLQPGIAVTPEQITGTVLIQVTQGSVDVTLADGEHRVDQGGLLQGVANGVYAVTNPGRDPATFLEIQLLDAVATTSAAMATGYFSDPTGGVVTTPIHLGGTLPGGVAHLRLERMTLPPGVTAPPYRVSELDWLGIGTGRVGISLEGEKRPFRWDAGEERTFALGQSLPTLAPGLEVTLRNPGTEPLILYRLRLLPDLTRHGLPADLAS